MSRLACVYFFFMPAVLLAEFVEFASPAAPIQAVIISPYEPDGRISGATQVLMEEDGAVLLLDVTGMVGNNGIPAGVIIEDAILELMWGDDGGAAFVSVESLRAPWRSSSVSWQFFGASGPTVADGALAAEPVWEGWVQPGTELRVAVGGDLQERVLGEGRYGWMVRVREGTGLLHLYSQASMMPGPVLNVYYSMPDSYFGPRLSDEELFAALRLDTAEAVAAVAAWDSGDSGPAWAHLEALFAKVPHVQQSGSDPATYLLEWIHDNPVPERVTSLIEHPWSTHFAGIRAGREWPGIWSNALCNPALPSTSFRIWLKSWIEHGRYLMESNKRRTNWVGFEASGLIHAGGLMKPLLESGDWLETGLARMGDMMESDVYPDGLQAELTVGYAQSLLFDLNRVHAFVGERSITLPTPIINGMELLYSGFSRLIQPDGGGPGFNDTWRTSLRGSLQSGYRQFPHRTDFLYASSMGQSGVMPDPEFHYFADGGILVLRAAANAGQSPFASDSHYLAVDFGPYGIAHGHEDKLSMILMAGEETIFGDTGRAVYGNSKWRSYVLNSWAHSTIRIDGLGQSRNTMGGAAAESGPAQRIAVRRESTYTYAAGSYGDFTFEPWGVHTQQMDPYARFSHRRHVFHLFPSTYVFLDVLRPRDFAEHDYESFWHLGRSWTSLQAHEHGYLGVLPSGTPVSFSFFGSVPAQIETVVGRESGSSAYPEELLGWELDEASRIPIPVLHATWRTARNNWQALVVDVGEDAVSGKGLTHLQFDPDSGQLELTIADESWLLPVDPDSGRYEGLCGYLRQNAYGHWWHPGWGEFQLAHDPWVWNEATGWMWVSELATDWLAVWHVSTGSWLWIRPDIRDWAYDATGGNWIQMK